MTDETIDIADLARTELTDKEKRLLKIVDKQINIQIVDFMTEYITDHDVPSLIELVLKAIQKVEGEEE